MIAGSAAGVSDVSPLQPNQTPPVCWSAASTPTASPPGAAPRLGSEMRLETQTRRLTRMKTHGTPPGSGNARQSKIGGRQVLPHLQPAHAGPESQSPYQARRHVQRQHPDAGVSEEVLDHAEDDVERVLRPWMVRQVGNHSGQKNAGTGSNFTQRLDASVEQEQLRGQGRICHIHGLGRADNAAQMEQRTGLFDRVVHANRDRGTQFRDEDRIVRGDLEAVGGDGNFPLSRHPMLYTVTSHSRASPWFSNYELPHVARIEQPQPSGLHP